MRPIIVCLAFLVLPVLTAAPAAAQSVPAPMAAPPLRELSDSGARGAIGSRVSVTGPVAQVKAHSHDGTAYLNFGGRFPAHTFAVIIPDSAVARFGDLARFEGRRVRATGTVWLQDGKWPAMTVTDPAALEIVP